MTIQGRESVLSLADLIGTLRSRSQDESFLDWLEGVRGRLIWSLVALLVTVVIGFVLAMKVDVLGVLIEPVTPYLDGTKLKYLSPTDPFFVTLRVGILIGVVLALPVLMYHVWALIHPLLRGEERRILIPLLLAVVVLFAAGALFCFLAVVPLALRFILGFQVQSLEQNLTIGAYLSFVLRLMLAFGAAFELPIIMLVATMVGVVTPEMFSGKRRHAAVAALVLGALLTPPDPASQLLMAVPLYCLFEVGIVVSRVAAARGVRARTLPEV